MESILSAARVAAIYDIHGNLPALDAVLRDINEQVDLTVIGGDVAWGPLPRDTIGRLRDLDRTTAFVRGNADREVADRAGEGEGLDRVVAEINLWCADQLSPEELSWMRELPGSVVVDVESRGRTLFCHGSPRSDEEMLTAGTPPRRMAAALAGVDADLVVCGHTHMQFDTDRGPTRVVNAGSVGLPYEREPGAYWVLIGPEIDLRRTTYDLDAAISEMSLSGCPHAEMVFFDTLRRPPPQAEVIARFEATAGEQTY